MLRSRKSRSEEPLETHVEHIESRAGGHDPQREAELADSVGLALLVVLEKLSPTERLAFVLHDMFDVPFNDIATIIDCTPVAARQLASRARRRVRGTSEEMPDNNANRQREVVGAFLAASRGGDFEALLRVLDPDVVLRADSVAAEMAAARQASGAPDLSGALRGAAAVAKAMSGRAGGAQSALLNGVAGAVWAPGGKTRVAFRFTIAGDQVVEIELVANPQTLGQLDIEILDAKESA
jgi:RNA polymerase sigma-70 factor (ECF subfamily)